MIKYIDAEKLIAEVKRRMDAIAKDCKNSLRFFDFGRINGMEEILNTITSIQQEQPEPYFYCKYGGTIPLCSDCKRNHNNSSFKTEEITTWYATSHGTKHCVDYIRQEPLHLADASKMEQTDVDLEKELKNLIRNSDNGCSDLGIARHFYELGKAARKED